MVGLTREQRRMLIDKLPDAANLALGGLVFGQFPRRLAVFSGGRPSRNCDVGRLPRLRGDGCMTGLYIIFGGMLLFVTIVVAYDLLARRQHRRQREEQRRSA